MKKFLITLLFFAIGFVPAFANEAEYMDALQRSIDSNSSLNEQYSACVELQNDENIPTALQEAVFFRKIYLVATSNADAEKRAQMLERYKNECKNISENYKVNMLYSGLYEIAVGNVKKGTNTCDEAFGMMLYESGNSMKMKAKGLYKNIFDLTKELCSENPSVENVKTILERK